MKNALMQVFKVINVELVNNVKVPAKKIELGFNYSYNVKYSNKDICIGELTAKITDKNSPEEFRITVVGQGIFKFSQSESKDRIHFSTYDDMYVSMRAFVSTLTVNAGMPPINMPYIDISKKDVYRVEMDKNGRPAPNPDDFINPYAENN